MKPDVVFFGDTVPKADVEKGRWVENADAVLVVGTSLMVYSSFRCAQGSRVGRANCRDQPR